ncbi:peptide-methionine (S)-S-oxide reductase MsrA [Alkalicoccobacillus porphyridii]|uniref:Peptide methionine sulfoxide reductase MsrA n=1 Tax=Alkalicoccobacillus porphyridii TaxID=2597270 RepID=A0A553ZUJ0_9BACI|nr:peptide-methionine (S)-S-oxide reductase MsrA [Alkalicoccobacillus porphyridii]TSB45144.1 peptide-methionine (S)-S-oxide reductase MsrA [Alkalicoccobacillus porphyridii]
MEKATFAGGCFWCMVQPFDELPGIISVTSGYTGGVVENPIYEQVKTGETGHYEAVQIEYNPKLFSYEKLLSLFWVQIDPTDAGGQFQDRGSQYKAAIFYHTEAQQERAQQSKLDLAESGRFKNPIVTEILPASVFYPAEEEHQDFYKKQKKAYKEDRSKSGRDEFIESNWTLNN